MHEHCIDIVEEKEKIERDIKGEKENEGFNISFFDFFPKKKMYLGLTVLAAVLSTLIVITHYLAYKSQMDTTF